MLVPGSEFNGYAVGGVLGRGGHAVVYRARAHDTTTDVALKVLDERDRRSADVEQLRREYAFAKRLHHPHVIGVHDVGADWLTMDLVDGGTLSSLATSTDRLTALAQIADALDYIHAAGIVHCDVKPANILVGSDFSDRGAVLVDFGVAHDVAQQVGDLPPAHIAASLPYAAPELLRGTPPAAAGDEYALACTTVEALTGSPPFVAKTTLALVDQHLHQPPPRISHTVASVPRAVDSIIAKAMAKDPAARYTSCSELIALISRAMRVHRP